MTDAPLRFGERGAAGPPKLREPSHEPVLARHERSGAEPDAPARPPADTAPEPAGETGEAGEAGETGETGANGRLDVAPVPPKPSVTGEAAALSRRERKQAARRRARKVKRIVRRFDAWSVMKVSFVFYLCMYVVTMVALLLIWNVADRAGAIDNVEGFIESVGFESFEFVPDQLFEATALGGAILSVLATAMTALGAVLFNLISDLVGGIRMTVIEEPGSMPARRRRSVGSRSEDPATVTGP